MNNGIKAVVILYNGHNLNDSAVAEIAKYISNETQCDIEKMSITIMDEKEMAKSVAYLLNTKKDLKNMVKVIESEDLDPIAASIVYLSRRHKPTNGVYSFTISVMEQLSKKEDLLALSNAIEILATKGVSNYKPLMSKYGFTSEHLTAIRSIYNYCNVAR